ncbi:MAG: type II secretion system protein GspG [Akkermansiaceae bacterium]|jgi:hypothetical protein|nr:type II secretion system protein GspG [Akkermansiaceae bacterium]
MPYPLPFLRPLVVAGLIVFAFTLVLRFFSSRTILESHTAFALSQMVEHIHQTDRAKFPRTNEQLIELLKLATIDWNSCRIEGDDVLDGWGRPLTLTFDSDKQRWTFRSSGKDGLAGTDDDIEQVTYGFVGVDPKEKP